MNISFSVSLDFIYISWR